MQNLEMRAYKAQNKTEQELQSAKNLETSFVLDNDEVLDENTINKIVTRLINGQTCQATLNPPSAAHRANTIYASDKGVIDASVGDKNRKIMFEGNILYGGIYDEEKGLFVSDDRQFGYKLQEDSLIVSSFCTKQQFSIKCFNEKEKSFGIRLSKNPLKELAVVMDMNRGMQGYVNAFKEIAPQFAKHIFKTRSEQESYVKLLMVTYAYLYVDVFGPFYENEEFLTSMKKLQTRDASDRMVYYSLVNAMSYFAKDNHLAKEIYLFAGGSFSDPHNEAKALDMTKNINKNAIFNSKEAERNALKIHTFALGKDLDFLKNLAEATGGTYTCVKDSNEFKKAVLTLANDGVFDPSDLKGEIRPAKTNKLYDPDDPDNT